MSYGAAQAVAAAPANTSATVTPATTSSATPAASSNISVGANGYIHGIDGMLDQISGALLRQAKTEILPTLQNDRELQMTVGRAAGKAMAKPLWVIAGVAAVYVGWVIWTHNDERHTRSVRANPGSLRSTRRRRY